MKLSYIFFFKRAKNSDLRDGRLFDWRRNLIQLSIQLHEECQEFLRSLGCHERCPVTIPINEKIFFLYKKIKIFLTDLRVKIAVLHDACKRPIGPAENEDVPIDLVLGSASLHLSGSQAFPSAFSGCCLYRLNACPIHRRT
jgi:hypothetical protein